MPRLTKQQPRLCRKKRKKSRDEAVVYIDGREHYCGRWNTDEAKERYDRLIAEWLANGRQLPGSTADAGPDETTVTEVCVAYTDHATLRYDRRDLDHIKGGLRAARELYGSEPASTFGPKRLRIVRQQMLDSGLARRTVNKRINWLRTAFKWAASHELCDEGIHRRLATVPGLRRGEGGRETDKVMPVPRADIRRIRRHVPRQVRALIDLQLLTGARADELVRLRPADINTGGQGAEVWTVKFGDHKTAHHGKERTVYLGPRAQRVIGRFMGPDRPLNTPLFNPREAYADARRTDGKGRRPNQKANPRKTERTIGEHYTTASYRRAIHRACEATGVAKWGPHRLRHNAATSLRRQFGIDVASLILGHSSLAVTQTYAEANHKRAMEVMAKVG